jgi:hypothetical protein
MSIKALETESVSPYAGSVRGSWWEGSYAEDSESHVMEGCGNSAFLSQGS